MRHQEGLPPRTCPTCGNDFQPYRAHQKTCSRNCRSKLPEVRATTRAYFARDDVRERKNSVRRVANNPRSVDVNRKRNLARYGITPAEYDAMVEVSGNRCSICGDPPDPNGKRAASRLHVDHDHVTGKVRGLLCLSCNAGIGYFKDDITRLHAAVAYIERHRST